MERHDERSATPASVLVANPSADVYGSDLQMLESVTALTSRGHRVHVVTPDDGPLIAMLRDRGATTELLDVPVVRRANASPRGIVELAVAATAAMPRMLRAIRRVRPDVIYVNTMTIPWWSAAGRLTRVPVMAHVHEAEADDPRAIRLALNGPLLLADEIVVNSRTSLEAMTQVVPRLERRAVVIHNGVAGPPTTPVPPAGTGGTRRIAIVGRLSPRKGVDVALRAVSQLRSEGVDVAIDVAGTAFEGYEWYVAELEALARTPDLAGAVDFLGYVDPVWPVLDRADVVVAPSVRESLGNAVIEAQLAARPVVASATTGHLESVTDEQTGLLFPVGDVPALTAAVRRVLEDPDLARRLASSGRESASEHFSTDRYGQQIADEVQALAR